MEEFQFGTESNFRNPWPFVVPRSSHKFRQHRANNWDPENDLWRLDLSEPCWWPFESPSHSFRVLRKLVRATISRRDPPAAAASHFPGTCAPIQNVSWRSPIDLQNCTLEPVANPWARILLPLAPLPWLSF